VKPRQQVRVLLGVEGESVANLEPIQPGLYSSV
jgi:hypothetical protein